MVVLEHVVQSCKQILEGGAHLREVNKEIGGLRKEDIVDVGHYQHVALCRLGLSKCESPGEDWHWNNPTGIEKKYNDVSKPTIATFVR